jgi:hypothetical protein
MCHLLRGGRQKSRMGDVSCQPLSKNGTSPHTVSQNWIYEEEKGCHFYLLICHLERSAYKGRPVLSASCQEMCYCTK